METMRGFATVARTGYTPLTKYRESDKEHKKESMSQAFQDEFEDIGVISKNQEGK